MPRPRVLLLDDDPSARCFVAMALAELPLDLVECEHVAAALAALRAAPCDLLLTDLVLRGESGLDLLRHLQHEPGLLPGGRVIVLSAALGAAAEPLLDNLPVWRTLAKPATFDTLQACVGEALGLAPSAAQAAAARSGPEALAMRRHFGGDAAMFDAFRTTCRAQFTEDLAEGDAALAAGDRAALQRLGHSLKTVLQLIGRPELAAQAAALDAAAAAADGTPLHLLWQSLRNGLGESLADAPQPTVERPSGTVESGSGGLR